jgi:hypothetical protein
VQLAHAHAGELGLLGGFRRGKLTLEPAQRGVAVDRVFQRRALERGRLLRDVRDAPARRVVDLALVGVELARSSAKSSTCRSRWRR